MRLELRTIHTPTAVFPRCFSIKTPKIIFDIQRNPTYKKVYRP